MSELNRKLITALAGIAIIILGCGWVWFLRYEVRAFFTGKDPEDLILTLPILWIPGAIVAFVGLWMLIRSLLVR